MTDDREELTPAESRVRTLLSELADDGPRDGERLSRSVVRAVRWQRPVRRVLVTLGAAGGGRRRGCGVRVPGIPAEVIAAAVLDRAADTLGGFLPRLAGAVVLVVLGWLVVALLRRLLVRGLRMAGLDALGERLGVGDVLERFGLGRSVSSLIGNVVRIALLMVIVFAALSLLGLQFLSASLNAGILFLPRIIVALVLVLAGIVVAELARKHVDRLAEQMDLPGPLGLLAEAAILSVFGVTALAHLGVPVAVLLLIVAILLAGVALTFALAFGIGGQAMAKEVSARRYVEGAYSVGQDVSLGEHRGRIAAIDATATVLETAGGERLRVPNSQMVASVVTVHSTA